MRIPGLALALSLGCLASATLPAASPEHSMPTNPSARQGDWWKHAVFYEIYPRSFADSNNDGTGDLNGITAHLDYLQALGIDAIWITPCFPSPQVDFGYDVSDYRAIDPQYGTLADFDRLVAEGAKRGIKVILDLVVNHSSDQHPWFKESRKSKDNPYRDYYVWRDGKNASEPPSNWNSCFGGAGWDRDPATNQWFYHYFYAQQPDLNWRNPKVEQEIFDITRFWYQRGVYGFRLDAVDALFEDPQLRDNPLAEGTNAYGRRNQQEIRNKLPEEVHGALQRLRKVADEYPGRVLIGETWTSTPQELAAYYGPRNNELQLPMYFNFAMVNKPDAATLRARVEAIEANAVGGWPTYVLSNHDIRRHIERYGDGVHNDAIARIMATLLLTLRGTPILYYGEELGMTNNDPKRIEDVKDVIGQRGWPLEKGRDGERTPMQWDATVNAGFNTGAATWLPVNPNYPTRNAASETRDPNSMLSWYRDLIRLRRTNEALSEGSYASVDAGKDVFAYLRTKGEKKVLVVLNMSPEAKVLDLAKTGSSGRSLLGVHEGLSLAKLQVEAFGVRLIEVR